MTEREAEFYSTLVIVTGTVLIGAMLMLAYCYQLHNNVSSCGEVRQQQVTRR